MLLFRKSDGMFIGSSGLTAWFGLGDATVADEVEFGIYFITSVIMDVMLDITADLRTRLRDQFPAPHP